MDGATAVNDDTARFMATRLGAACKARERFRPLEHDGARIPLELAYRIQDHFVAGLQAGGLGRVLGYKVGLTSEKMQHFCGVPQPIMGRVLEPRVFANGTCFDSRQFVRLGVECEMALRIGRTVPVLAEDAAPGLLRDCVATAHAGLEIVEDRAADYATLDAASIVAENSWNAGLVAGEGVAPQSLGDLDGIAGRLLIDGAVAGQGTSSDVLGGPLVVLKWLARFLATCGERLEPGQWVVTGSIIPTQFPRPGERLRFELAGLPAVEIDVA